MTWYVGDLLESVPVKNVLDQPEAEVGAIAEVGAVAEVGVIPTILEVEAVIDERRSKQRNRKNKTFLEHIASIKSINTSPYYKIK